MARQGGRRSTGPRAQFTLRVPEDHGERYRAAAEAAGFTIIDYLAHTLAKVHGLEFEDSDDAQQRLPLESSRDAIAATRHTSAA
jgi:hypothetical protein